MKEPFNSTQELINAARESISRELTVEKLKKRDLTD